MDPIRWQSGKAFSDLVYLYALEIAKYKGDEKAVDYIQMVYNNIPSEFVVWKKRYYRKSRARLHIEMAFFHRDNGNLRRVLKNVMAGVVRDPSWLRNRGVLSIFYRSSMDSVFGN